jgi:hypothetical protein
MKIYTNEIKVMMMDMWLGCGETSSYKMRRGNLLESITRKIKENGRFILDGSEGIRCEDRSVLGSVFYASQGSSGSCYQTVGLYLCNRLTQNMHL